MVLTSRISQYDLHSPPPLAGIGLIALAMFQPELAIPALVAGLVAIIGDDKTHLDRKPPEPEC